MTDVPTERVMTMLAALADTTEGDVMTWRAFSPDTIRSLLTELLALREAVKPFADESGNWHPRFGDDSVPVCTPHTAEPADDARERAAFTVGDLRRAARAFQSHSTGDDK